MAPKSNKLKDKKPATEVKQGGKSNSKTKTIKKKSPKSKSTQNIFSDPRLMRSLGFLLLMSGIYLFLAISTYIVNWFAADVSVVASTASEAFMDHTKTVSNWTGWLGAFISKYIVYNGIGVGSYFISIVFIFSGLRLLLNIKIFNLWRWFELLVMSFLWFPITLNLIFSNHPENILGGLSGHQLNIVDHDQAKLAAFARQSSGP
mgnify:CR=1 FL=1